MEGSGTDRLETFSDGVFAIAATLLVLELSVGGTTHGDLGHKLLHLWPGYLAYATSFLTIGIIWVNHHAIFELIGRSDRTLMFVNTVFLLVVAFIPFPTRLVAHYLTGPDERAAVLAYDCTLLLMAVLFNVLWRYPRRRLLRDDAPHELVAAIDRSFAPGIPIYAVILGVAFASATASVALTLAAAVFYIPSSWLTRRREPAAG
jgi:TMEM175 potassium channel family protein